MDIVKTACPRDCFGGCTMKVFVEEGRIVKLQGDEGSIATGGKLCAKGMSYIDYVYSPNRVKYPLLRKGERGRGEFEEVSWEKAIEVIGKSMMDVIDKKGPEGIMYYSSGGCQGLLSDYYQGFFNQCGGYTTTRGNLCYSAGIEAARLTYGEVIHNAPWDLENASLIVLWGKNPAYTNIQEMKFINTALSKGSKLITIDPVRNKPYKPDLHISPSPGTDMALALCIMNILVDKNYIDREFIDAHTQGFGQLEGHVAEYTPLKVSEICGIDIDDIYKMAELIHNNGPVTLVCGYGLQRYKNGGQTVRAISMIPALIGQVGVKGGGFRFANKQWKLNWPFVPDVKCEVRDDYPASMLGKALDEYENPGIGMLWVERGNPLTMNPDTNGLKKSMSRLDFIVVADQFFTDTARYADVVLPAQTFFEYDDIFAGYWTPYLNYSRKVIPPYFEARNESQIYRMLGDYMGYNMDCLPEYNSETLDKILECSGIDVNIEKLKEGPYILEGTEIAFKDRKFKTPSGRIELYSETMQKKWGKSPMPTFEDKQEDGKYPLRFLSTHARERIHSQFYDIPGLGRGSDKALLYINEDDASDRGIKDGDRVMVYNENGEIFAYACVCDYIKKRVVNIYEGLPESSGASVNMLTCQESSDIGYGAVYYDCTVEVVRCPQ